MAKTNQVECRTGRIALQVEERENAVSVNIEALSSSECVDIYLNDKVVAYMYITPKDGYTTMTVFANKHRSITVHRNPSKMIKIESVNYKKGFKVTRFTNQERFEFAKDD